MDTFFMLLTLPMAFFAGVAIRSLIVGIVVGLSRLAQSNDV